MYYKQVWTPAWSRHLSLSLSLSLKLATKVTSLGSFSEQQRFLRLPTQYSHLVVVQVSQVAHTIEPLSGCLVTIMGVSQRLRH